MQRASQAHQAGERHDNGEQRDDKKAPEPFKQYNAASLYGSDPGAPQSGPGSTDRGGSTYVLPPQHARVSYMSSGSVQASVLAVVPEHLYRLPRHLPRHLYCARAP